MNLAFRNAVEGVDDRPRLPGSLHVHRRLDQWLALDARGTVEIRPGKVELGQGILTALAQIAAEELDVALPRIQVRSAATPDSPDEAVTSGSLSVQECGMALRHACADARRIFLSVCAQRTGVAFDHSANAVGRSTGVETPPSNRPAPAPTSPPGSAGSTAG